MANPDIRDVSHAYEFVPSESNSTSPVLVFIHGWLLSRHYWLPLIKKLKPHFSCLNYDLRGFGNSQLSTTDSLNNHHKSLQSQYSLASYAQDLQSILNDLDIQEAWLIGHSLGGSIAIWGAYLCQQRIKGVICVNAGGGIYLKEEFERFRNAGENLVKFRPSWLTYIGLLDFIFARMMVDRPLSRRWGHQRVIDFVKADKEAAIGSLLDSTTEEEVHLLPQIVAKLTQPVYFLAGDRDKVMETKYVRHLASFHSLFHSDEGNVIEIPNCGHFAMLEQISLVQESILTIIGNY